MKISAVDILGKDGVPEADYEYEEYSSRDEAIQHAKSYWMLGWAWDEIEAILTDMKFSDGDVSAAIKEAQEYAYDALSNGPFALFKEGQLIKLTNGSTGVFLTANKSEAVICIDNENVRVSEKHIDKAGSAKLLEAYGLRKAASDLLKTVAQFQHGEIVEPPEEVEETTPLFTEIDKQKAPAKRPRGRPRKNPAPPALEPTTKELALPGPPKSRMDVVPSPEETLNVYTQLPGVKPKAPGGWGELVPKMSDTEDVSVLATEALDQIDALLIEKKKVKEENDALNSMAKEIKDKLKGLQVQEVELAKKIFAIISTQTRDLNNLDKTVFYKYKNKLVGLQQTITSQEVPVGVMDELTAVKEFLQLNHPLIADQTEAALDTWKKQNMTIKEQIQKILAYWGPVREEKSAQLVTKVKNWFAETWNSIKSISSELYDSLFPTVDEGIALIDALEMGIDAESGRLAIAKAMKVRVG